MFKKKKKKRGSKWEFENLKIRKTKENYVTNGGSLRAVTVSY